MFNFFFFIALVTICQYNLGNNKLSQLNCPSNSTIFVTQAKLVISDQNSCPTYNIIPVTHTKPKCDQPIFSDVTIYLKN